MCTFYTIAKIDEKLVLENVLCVLAYFACLLLYSDIGTL